MFFQSHLLFISFERIFSFQYIVLKKISLFIGEGDTGDVWSVVCEGDFWQRDDAVMFKHADTGVFLGASGHTFGRPIHGQMEIVGLSMPDVSTK